LGIALPAPIPIIPPKVLASFGLVPSYFGRYFSFIAVVFSYSLLFI
jgi:hypothetical protein